MTKYNLIIIECKTQTPYLDLTKEELFEHLWEWTYDDDLWYNIDEWYDNEVKRVEYDEELEGYIVSTFIPENMFHNYEEDEVDCVAFSNGDKVSIYEGDEDLLEFVKNKIKEHYEKV
jgi:hypothetical protein